MIHVIDSLPRAITHLCNRMTQTATLTVFDDSTKTGYWLTIKRSATPPEAMNDQQARREIAKYKNPQPHHIAIEEWPAWMYGGFDKGEQSSKF